MRIMDTKRILIVFDAFLQLMSIQLTAAVSSGACVTFDATNVLNSSLLCAAVVNYPFYLPTGWSLDNLNAEAVNRVGGPDAQNQSRAWYLLSSQCHASARQLACVETHSECLTIGETTTSLKPCRSLCHVVDNSCGHAARSVGYAAYDCSSSSFADVNCSRGTDALVGENVEAYIGSTCNGISSNVSIPNAMQVDASFAPLQPAGAVQSALEVAVTAVIAALPDWATRECQRAARIFMCASYLPMVTKDISPIVGAPRLASHDTCDYYHKACAGALVRGEAYLDQRLFVDCSRRIGVATFPGETYEGYPVFGNETVLDIGGVIGAVRTAPSFRVDSVEFRKALSGVDTSLTCPYGSGSYHLDGRPGRLHISGTACAIACPAPYLSEKEHLSRSGTELIYSVVTLTVTFYSMLTYTWVRERRRNQPLFMVTFVLAFAKYVLWNFPKVVTLAIEGFKDWDFRTVGCHDRVSPMLQSDNSVCALQGLMYVAVSLAVSIAAAVIAFDVYVRTTFVPANPMKLVYRYYFPFLFISFPLLCVAPLVATKGNGYTFEKGFMPPATVCGASNAASLSYFLTMSFLVYVVMCIFICGGVRQLLKAVKRVKSMKSVRPVGKMSYENAQQTGVRRKKLVQSSMIDKKTLKFIQIPMIYLLARTFEILINYIYFAILANGASAARNEDQVDKWYDCLFEHWGLDLRAQKRECGEAPGNLTPRFLGTMEVVFLFSTFREVFYVLLFSLSKESVRAWIKQHPSLKPYFCGLESKTDLVERISSSVAMTAAATFSVCDKSVASHDERTTLSSKGSSVNSAASVSAEN